MRETRSSGLMRGTKDDPWSLLYRNLRQVLAVPLKLPLPERPGRGGRLGHR